MWALHHLCPKNGLPHSKSPLELSNACPADRLRGYTLRVGVLPPSDPNHFTQSAICYTTTGSQGSPTQYYTCTPSLAGRYVSLRIDGRAECLNIAEVQVYGMPIQLLSQGKPASLSSAHPAFPAGNANDGDLNNFAHSTCGLDGAGPWWSMDLGGARHDGAGDRYLWSGAPLDPPDELRSPAAGVATVSVIAITNRRDCCQGGWGLEWGSACNRLL